MYGLRVQIERRLSCDTESVPAGRWFTARTLERAGLSADGPGGQIFCDALLIVTELLANAVRAGRDLVVLHIGLDYDCMELAVADDCPHPATWSTPTVDATSGRGVSIVAALSACWGQTDWDGTSKRVWSRLALPPGVHFPLDALDRCGKDRQLARQGGPMYGGSRRGGIAPLP